MAKKPSDGKIELEFDMRLTKFKFTNETCFRGAVKPPTNSSRKKIRFTHHITRDIYKTLKNERERDIKFHFTLEMLPDLGEINFDGECVLESPQQDKVAFCLDKQIPQFLSYIDEILFNESYKNSEKIGKANNIPIPPLDFVLQTKRKK